MSGNQIHEVEIDMLLKPTLEISLFLIKQNKYPTIK
jgi:hypothetical protein